MSKQLPPGVFKKRDRWVVRVARTRGSTSQVQRTFTSEADALAAYYAAIAARDVGGDVEAALEGVLTKVAPTRPVALKPVRTFQQLADEYLEERRLLSEASDHRRRRSISRGVNTLRPTTHKRDIEELNRVLFPRFGHMRVDEIDRAQTSKWMIELADHGYAPTTAAQYLIRLKAILGQARQSERSDDYPWKGVAAVTPAHPLRPPPNPEMWQGAPGSPPPVFPFKACVELASLFEPADRVALYCEEFGGPRIGETFGLRLKDFQYRVEHGDRRRLWVKIWRQVDEENVDRDWVKSDAGYRTIPLANILARYLESYVERYHDAKLDDLDPSTAKRRLVVNPAGRDFDGSFLPGLRSTLGSRWGDRRDAGGFGHDVLGYFVTSQHLRKSLSTYLLHMESLLASIAEDDPEPFGDDKLRMAWLERRHEERKKLNFSPMHISSYLGHDNPSLGEEAPASLVTLKHYNLSFDETRPFEAIADAIDAIAEHEVGTLLDQPSENDLLPVHLPDNPDWITVDEATLIVGVNHGNVIQAIHRGVLVGELAWIANGGYRRNTTSDKRVPAKPQFVVLRSSAVALGRLKSLPAIKAVANRLGMSAEGFTRNFVDTGRVGIELDGPRRIPDPDDVDTVVSELHEAILEVLKTSGPLTARQITAVFNERHGDLFVEGRALERWVAQWLCELTESGFISIRLTDQRYVVRGRRRGTNTDSNPGDGLRAS